VRGEVGDGRGRGDLRGEEGVRVGVLRGGHGGRRGRELVGLRRRGGGGHGRRIRHGAARRGAWRVGFRRRWSDAVASGGGAGTGRVGQFDVCA
jgi:hypothetical protein